MTATYSSWLFKDSPLKLNLDLETSKPELSIRVVILLAPTSPRKRTISPLYQLTRGCYGVGEPRPTFAAASLVCSTWLVSSYSEVSSECEKGFGDAGRRRGNIYQYSGIAFIR